MSGDAYATDKIRWHPGVLERMRRGEQEEAPLLVQFMPMLACNQHCSFCAYGHRLPGDPAAESGWKNMAMMGEGHMGWEKSRECLRDFSDMGVRALEITGGGEPLIWPHIDRFLDMLKGTRIEVGLVTNGTALTVARAFRFAATRWKWARVSIDAGTPAQYAATRRVPESHWGLAWDAVGRLAAHRSAPDQKVGVGYVVDRTNMGGLRSACAMARDRGADNLRVSLCFSPQGLGRFDAAELADARAEARACAEEFATEAFRVVNLLDERAGNLASPRQDYTFCGSKEVLCVVGGDCNVYTCCTLAFNPKGLIGSIASSSFRDLWRSDGKRSFFASHDASSICDMECLYERRNRQVIAALEHGTVPDGPPPPHVNFI